MVAEYFRTQKELEVNKVIREAIMAYGRPNQILADNGTQFRNLIGEIGPKYTKPLEYLILNRFLPDIITLKLRENSKYGLELLNRCFSLKLGIMLILTHDVL